MCVIHCYYCCDKALWPMKVLEKSVYLAYAFKSSVNVEWSQDRNSEQSRNVETGTGGEAI